MKRQRNNDLGPIRLKLGSVLIACAFVGISGCKKEEIHSYRVPRESEFVSAAAPAQPQATPARVAWTVPDSWQEVETTRSMRKATFEASNGQEISVTAFPGDVGGLLANVNRWRGQVGLDPIGEERLADGIERVDGVDVTIVDLDGTDSRLVGSIINVGDGQTWFVKATGAAETVGLVKDDLIAFSSTFHIHDHGSEASQSTPQQVAGVTDSPSGLTASGWTQPAEWKAEENASTILMAAYLSESGARITVTSLKDDGGGALSNINRWRGQLGLPLIQSLAEQQFKDLGDGAMIVDLVAFEGDGRMAAGIVPLGGQTVFFKLTGSAAAVEAELERFEAFINAEGLGKIGAP